MMAARAGAASVTTCETVHPIACVAREIIAMNGLSDQIDLVPKHSEQLVLGEDMAARAELLVTETFASGVLSESVLPTIEHARLCLLTPDAQVIPCRAKARAYLIGGDLVEANLFAPRFTGFDLTGFDVFAPSKIGLHLDRLPHAVLSDDFELFDFDLTQTTFAPQRRTLSVTATGSGRCIGVAQWLWLQMDEHGVYENRPDDQAGANGWMHVIYRFNRPVELAVGDEVKLLASHSRKAMTVALSQ